MEFILAALLLGLAGSFHCAGMCGPIALSLPLNGPNWWSKISGGLLYNVGRTATYGILGAFFGWIGQGLHLLGFQQWVSIGAGSVMILSVILPALFSKISSGGKELPFAKPVRHAIQRLFAQKSNFGLLFVGMLNGLLPCGLVYLAIAGAIGTAGVMSGALFMIVFGLGTIPMMLTISVIGSLISLSIRRVMNRMIPYLIVVVGLLFILRGLCLGIPYLSPPAEKMKPAVHSKNIAPNSIKHSCCHGSTEN